jgi:hypothetical protein
MGKSYAAVEKHLGQITETQFVPDAPEDVQTDDLCGVLQAVEQRPGSLIKALLAGPTAKPPVPSSVRSARSVVVDD